MPTDVPKTYDIATALNGGRRADQLSRDQVVQLRMEIVNTIWRAVRPIGGAQFMHEFVFKNDTEFTWQHARDIRGYFRNEEFEHVTEQDLNLLLSAWRGLCGVEIQQ